MRNAWGLHDMHGNVWEWCQDWYAQDYYAGSPTDDPRGPEQGSYRVYRGGGWYIRAEICRSAYRDWNTPENRNFYLGFRVALEILASPTGNGRKRAEQVGAATPAAAGMPKGIPTAKSGLAPPLAIAPFDDAKAKQHQQAWADHLGLPVEMTNSVGMKLRLIPPGEFDMGSTQEEVDRLLVEARQNNLSEFEIARLASEAPRHRVRITRAFYLGVCEVTQGHWEAVMGANPSRFKGASNPVETVSWDDAMEFCKKLSTREGKTYCLPTEAEREYACRAGTTTVYSFGDDESQLGAYAWYGDNSDKRTHPVGEKKPNAWGLHDMHGNVWEWCQNWKGEYSSDAVTDPQGPTQGKYRVYRGGCWSHFVTARDCRSADRNGFTPETRNGAVGFRIALEIPVSPKGNGQKRSEQVGAATPPAAAGLPKGTPTPKPGQAPPLAVAPFDATQAKRHQQAWADHLGVPVEMTNSIGMKMVLIPPGEFMMGSTEQEIAEILGKGEKRGWASEAIKRFRSESPSTR
jgi:formylglycine-generating enzyme required for sulfatase activity